jgi:DNA topoisomerase-2
MRKEWLTTYNENEVLDHNASKIRYKDFINKELIQFSVYDNMRSIPSVVDGLKPSQRKILYGCFKKNLTSEMKVAQLSGYIAEHSAYHHGEMSLQMTIIGLAQNYVGSNNVNLLEPIGQFGTRALGGKDAASARYIHTCLSKITRYIFDKNDDEVLTYINDDGHFVEPTHYVPILPMILVNGAEGIGTGWSTFIPCYNPREIAHNIQRKLEGKDFEPLNPYYKGFTGEIIREGRSFLVKGTYHARVSEDILDITDLPIAKWTRAYKSFLESLITEPDSEVEDFKEFHTTNTVRFEVRLSPGSLRQLVKNDEIEKKFKLTSVMSNNNFVLFDREGKLKRYEDELEIMEEFFQTRLAFYSKRKEYLLSKLTRDMTIAANKERFVSSIIEDRLKLRNAKKSEIVGQLIDNGFTMMKDMPTIKSFMEENRLLSVEAVNQNTQATNDEEDLDAKFKEYSYLLSLPMWSMSYEEVERLKREVQSKEEALERLQRYSEVDMWKDDLQAFLDKLDEVERHEEAQSGETTKKQQNGLKSKNSTPKITNTLSKEKIATSVKKTEPEEDEGLQLKKRSQPKETIQSKTRNEKTLSSNKKQPPSSEELIRKTTYSPAEIEDLKAKDMAKLSLAERVALLKSQHTPTKDTNSSVRKDATKGLSQPQKQATLDFNPVTSASKKPLDKNPDDSPSPNDLKRLKKETYSEPKENHITLEKTQQPQSIESTQQIARQVDKPQEEINGGVVPQRKKVFIIDDED